MKPNIGQYYEGVLQLRNPKNDVIEFLNELVEERENIRIVHESKVVNGIDIYMDNQRYMISIGRKLQNRFGGELKITRKLFTVKRQTGKKIYRVNVLFKIPEFKVGDTIKYKGKEIKIKYIGKKVFGFDIKTGKKISIDYKDIKT
jgi:nonsense-mediated mRNA decay protein 3